MILIIKTIIIAKKILGKIIETLAKSLYVIFKFLFNKTLIKIYYQLFRLKHHYDLRLREIIKQHSAIILIIIISSILLFSNLLGDHRANALENKISHTLISSIVKQDFSGQDANEELIEEGLDLESVMITQQNSYTNDETIKKTSLQNNIPPTNDGGVELNDNKGVITKPQTIILNNTASSSNNRHEIIKYTIGDGDTISSIANKFGLKINTILWANNLSSLSLIHPGDQLMILPKDGILYTIKRGDTLIRIANKYSITGKSIKENNNLGSVLKVGETILLPKARKIYYNTSTKKKSSYTGIAVIKNFIKPANKKVNSSKRSKMLWPTVGHRITQYFSWHHPGLDIANKIGTPLYAADGGKVVYAGWSRGYGYNVVINHGNGIKTRYAHSSKLYVKVGDIVKRGETIAAMGSTGWSTGPHIHFEVIINGKRYNPLNYIK